MGIPERSESSSADDRSQPERRGDLSGLQGFIYSLNVRSIPLTGIFLLLLVFALKVGSSFFIPVCLAFLLKFLFASVVRWLERIYIPPAVSAALIILLLLGGVGTAIYRLATPARDWMATLPRTLRLVEIKLADVKKSMQEINEATKAMDQLTNLDGREKAQKVEVKNSKLGDTFLGPTHDFLVGAGIVLILLFFLLASGDLFSRNLKAAPIVVISERSHP